MTSTAIPTKPEELEDVLHDRSRIQQLMNTGEFPAFVTAYAKTVLNQHTELNEQVDLQVKATLAQFLKDNPGSGPAPSRPDVRPPAHVRDSAQAYQARKNALYNKAAPGAAADDCFETPAQFLQSVSSKVTSLPNAEDLLGRRSRLQQIQNTFGTNVPSDGGFLIPETFRSDLLMLALESALIRPRATVIPMETQRTIIPTVDETSHVSTLFGGIACYWVDEATAPTESSGKFGQVVLDTKKLMAYCTAPNELVADATAFGAFLDQSLPKAMAFESDYKFMQGTGVGEPLGFVSCPASVTVTAVAGQGAGTIVVENLMSMFSQMLPSSLPSAIWIANIECFPQLASMALSVGTGGSPVWMANNGIVDGPPGSIYGRPLYFTEKLPALGTTGDIMFIDPSFYLIGDRQTMQASSSDQFLFSSDRTAYRIVERLDGKPWLQSALTPRGGTHTLSPFVQLSSTRT